MSYPSRDFYVHAGANASLVGLTRLWADHRASRLRLEESGPDGPSLEAARGIDDLLSLCRVVRATWPVDRVDEWRRLVNSGMAPAVAREAVILIHAEAGRAETDAPAPTQDRWAAWGRGPVRRVMERVRLLRSRDCGWRDPRSR